MTELQPQPSPALSPARPSEAEYVGRKRARNAQPRCQVEGCLAPLSDAGEGRVQVAYYKRFSICREHASIPSLEVDGRAARFCQQCGRFQELQEFDGDRKSCRASLEKHNARRRRNAARKAGLKLSKSEPDLEAMAGGQGFAALGGGSSGCPKNVDGGPPLPPDWQPPLVLSLPMASMEPQQHQLPQQGLQRQAQLARQAIASTAAWFGTGLGPLPWEQLPAARAVSVPVPIPGRLGRQQLQQHALVSTAPHANALQGPMFGMPPLLLQQPLSAPAPSARWPPAAIGPTATAPIPGVERTITPPPPPLPQLAALPAQPPIDVLPQLAAAPQAAAPAPASGPAPCSAFSAAAAMPFPDEMEPGAAAQQLALAPPQPRPQQPHAACPKEPAPSSTQGPALSLQESLERVSLHLFNVPSSQLAPHVRQGVIKLMLSDPALISVACGPT